MKPFNKDPPCCDNLTLAIPNEEADLEQNGNRNILQTIPHVEPPKISNLNLESCNGVQIGTRIITSNLTVSGGEEGRITVQHTENNEKTVKETIVLSKWIKCFTCVLFVFLCVLTFFVLRLGYVLKNDETTSTTRPTTYAPNFTKLSTEVSTISTSTYLPTSVVPSWLITRTQWGSKHVDCSSDLGTVDTIKLVSGFDCGGMSCSNKIKRSQELANDFGEKDVEFHFAINSNNGATYEGRIHSCQTEKPYRECDKSFLIVRLYRINEEEDALCDEHASYLIGSLIQLVAYGQDESFIYGTQRDDVIIYLSYHWSVQYFTKHLNMHFNNISFYETDYDESCENKNID